MKILKACPVGVVVNADTELTERIPVHSMVQIGNQLISRSVEVVAKCANRCPFGEAAAKTATHKSTGAHLGSRTN